MARYDDRDTTVGYIVGIHRQIIRTSDVSLLSSETMPIQRPTPGLPLPAQGDLSTSISTHLASKHLKPTQAWLNSFLSTIRASTPLPALQKTALFRLLATDLTTSLQPSPSSTLPPNIADPTIQELRLPGPIPVQVLDIEDVGRSRWSQLEALEAAERGETRRGHEVIRVIPEEGTAAPPASAASVGPHKLLLQDAKGTKVFAFELNDMPGLELGMGIGAKLVLKGLLVARGVVMLELGSVEVLGGKVEAWEKKWQGERKAKLKERAGVVETD